MAALYRTYSQLYFVPKSLHFLLHPALVPLTFSGVLCPCALLNFPRVCTYPESVSWLLGNCSILFRLVQAKFPILIRFEVTHAVKQSRTLGCGVLLVYCSLKLVEPDYIFFSNVNPLLHWWGRGDNKSDQMCFYFLCSFSFICLRNVHHSNYANFSIVQFSLFSLAKLNMIHIERDFNSFYRQLFCFLFSFSSFFFSHFSWPFLLSQSHPFQKIKICNVEFIQVWG